MKTFFLFFLFLWALTNTVSAQDSLTVDEAVQRVIQTHPSIDQALAATRAAEARVLQVNAARSPEVVTEALYSRIGPVAELGMPGLGTFKLYPENNYDVHITGRYTVYDFGKTKAITSLNESRVQSTQDAVEFTKSGLALQTMRTFYSIILLQKTLQVQQEQIDALHEHLDVIQKRVATGVATNFDVLTTEVRVAAAQNQKVESENSMQRQEAALRQLLNSSEKEMAPLRGKLNANEQSFNGDSLIAVAFQQRMELKLANDAAHTAQLQRTVSGLGNVPSVKLNVSYGLKNGYIPNFDALHGNWIAGVKFEMPLYDADKTVYQQQEADANLIAEEAHIQEIERQIRTEVEQVLTDVHAASSKVQISALQLQQAHEAVSIARTRYETGSITNLDLLDAETAESAAKLAYVQALYRYVIGTIELRKAVGDKLY